MDVNFSINTKEFLKWQKQTVKEVKVETENLIREATLATEANAKRLCPVDKGALRQGIFSTITPNSGIVSTSPNTPYALFLHEGHWVREGQVFPLGNGEFRRIKETRFIEGQPFMSQAFDLISDDFEKEMDDILKKIK